MHSRFENTRSCCTQMPTYSDPSLPMLPMHWAFNLCPSITLCDMSIKPTHTPIIIIQCRNELREDMMIDGFLFGLVLSSSTRAISITKIRITTRLIHQNLNIPRHSYLRLLLFNHSLNLHSWGCNFSFFPFPSSSLLWLWQCRHHHQIQYYNQVTRILSSSTLLDT